MCLLTEWAGKPHKKPAVAKRCFKCGIDKPLTQFYKYKRLQMGVAVSAHKDLVPATRKGGGFFRLEN